MTYADAKNLRRLDAARIVLEASRVEAVDREIRKDKRIGKREGRMIHSLLRGR